MPSSFLGVFAVQKFLQYLPVFTAANPTPAAAAEASRVPAVLASTRLLVAGFPLHTNGAMAAFLGLPAVLRHCARQQMGNPVMIL